MQLQIDRNILRRKSLCERVEEGIPAVYVCGMCVEFIGRQREICSNHLPLLHRLPLWIDEILFGWDGFFFLLLGVVLQLQEASWVITAVYCAK